MDIEKIKEKIEQMKNDGSLDAMFEEIINREKKETEFFSTDEFKKLFENLKKYLQKHKKFCTDGVYYTETAEEKIFANNAITIYKTIAHNISNQSIIEDDTHFDEYMFPSTTFYYDGVGMRCTQGQGSSFSFWLKG